MTETFNLFSLIFHGSIKLSYIVSSNKDYEMTEKTFRNLLKKDDISLQKITSFSKNIIGDINKLTKENILQLDNIKEYIELLEKQADLKNESQKIFDQIIKKSESVKNTSQNCFDTKKNKKNDLDYIKDWNTLCNKSSPKVTIENILKEDFYVKKNLSDCQITKKFYLYYNTLSNKCYLLNNDEHKFLNNIHFSPFRMLIEFNKNNLNKDLINVIFLKGNVYEKDLDEKIKFTKKLMIEQYFTNLEPEIETYLKRIFTITQNDKDLISIESLNNSAKIYFRVSNTEQQYLNDTIEAILFSLGIKKISDNYCGLKVNLDIPLNMGEMEQLLEKLRINRKDL